MTEDHSAPSVDVWVFHGTGIHGDSAVEWALASYPGGDGESPAHGRDSYGRRTIPNRRELSLSTSDTDGVLAVVIGAHCRVGIDLEIARKRGILRLPEHSLTEREQRELSRLEETLRLRAFLSYWTRKEALLKAVGVGLAVEPSLIELPPPGGATHVIAVPERLGAAERWFVSEIEVEGCVAAVAADVRSPRLRIMRKRLVPTVVDRNDRVVVARGRRAYY